MRERLREIFAQLPPEGIAVHGTNMSRARNIQKEGFIPQNLHPGTPLNRTYYIVQPPNANPFYALEHLDEVKSYLIKEASGKYAKRSITWNQYEYSGTAEDKQPAIVVFKPLKVFDRNTHDFQLFPFPRIHSEDRHIPPNHIYGAIDISNIANERGLLAAIYQLLTQKGIIHISKPQSLPAV